ncbi:hypothetical protein [Paraburkholderia sp. BR14374]
MRQFDLHPDMEIVYILEMSTGSACMRGWAASRRGAVVGKDGLR